MNITELNHRKYRKLLRNARDGRDNWLTSAIVAGLWLIAIAVVNSRFTSPWGFWQCFLYACSGVCFLVAFERYVYWDNRVELIKELLSTDIRLCAEITRLEALEEDEYVLGS